jgi:hypothetical protein
VIKALAAKGETIVAHVARSELELLPNLSRRMIG